MENKTKYWDKSIRYTQMDIENINERIHSLEARISFFMNMLDREKRTLFDKTKLLSELNQKRMQITE